MEKNKSKKGKNWKGQLFIHDWSDPADPFNVPISSTNSLKRIRLGIDIEKTKLVRIYYYRSDMPEERAKMVRISDAIGVGGVIVSVAGMLYGVPLGKFLGMSDQLAADLRVVIVGSGTLMATAGATAGLSAGNIMFHGYLVIECTGGVWISLEKDEENIVVRIGRSVVNILETKEGSSSRGI